MAIVFVGDIVPDCFVRASVASFSALLYGLCDATEACASSYLGVRDGRGALLWFEIVHCHFACAAVGANDELGAVEVALECAVHRKDVEAFV